MTSASCLDMLSDSATEFLKHLLDAPGPSGFEGRAAAVWRDHARAFADVRAYVDDQGYIYLGPIGGWDPQVLVGQRVRFLGRDGEVRGVVGKKPIHLMK